MTEIKITPETKLDELSKQLGELQPTEKPRFVDNGDGVTIIFGKENSEVDPKGYKYKKDGGATHAEYAEMKAKSMLYDKLVDRASDDNAALVFSALSGDLFAVGGGLGKDPAETIKSLIDTSDKFQKEYFKKSRMPFGNKKRRRALDKFRQDLAAEHSKSEVEPSKSAASKAKESAESKKDPQKSESAAAWPKPSLDDLIQSDTSWGDRPQDANSWRAQFNIRTDKNEIISCPIDLKKQCDVIIERIRGRNKDYGEKVATNVADTLKSSSKRRKLENAIYKKLVEKLRDKSDRSKEGTDENRHDAMKVVDTVLTLEFVAAKYPKDYVPPQRQPAKK